MGLYNGARARALRRQAGVCVEELATAAGVSPNTVRAAESGTHQPRPRVANAIARALGVPLSELILDSTPTLRDIRWRLGLTQAQMAARIGVVRQRVSQVERGMPTGTSAARWATAYELTLDQWHSAHTAARDLVLHKVAAQTRRDTKQSTGGRTA